jgi:uncharacterized protein YgbK (DUF1537 family)
MLLGCIADDLTGATDLAVNLRAAGLAVLQVNGVPTHDLTLPASDAIVVALKSRTIAAADACAQSLAALHWLRGRGAQRIYFKICSTFDSTPAGNIGPVADALAEALENALPATVQPQLGAAGTLPIVCTPAYPRNQRTVYMGHLFVGQVLLSDSGMRTHPLTPMTDANLVRVLQAQTPKAVGLLPVQVVQQGQAAVQAALQAEASRGVRHVIADAIDDGHLDILARAIVNQPLCVGGAGLARALAGALAPAGAHAAAEATAQLQIGGPVAILAGSCSAATLAQLQTVEGRWPSAYLDVDGLMHDAAREIARVLAAVASSGSVTAEVVLVRASLAASELQQVQARHGRAATAQAVEAAFRLIAQALADRGVRRFIVAGGETSGAVIEALGVGALAIGAEIAPGVPWTTSSDGRYGLALKSGNFGDDDFLARAVQCAP